LTVLIVEVAPEGGTGRLIFASNDGSTRMRVMPQTTLGGGGVSVWFPASDGTGCLKNDVDGGVNNFEKDGDENVDRGGEFVWAAVEPEDTSVKPRNTNKPVTRIAPLQ
jgi:hypothetical protein